MSGVIGQHAMVVVHGRVVDRGHDKIADNGYILLVDLVNVSIHSQLAFARTRPAPLLSSHKAFLRRSTTTKPAEMA